ncbi:Transcriptional regulator [Streptomyces venezuelae]|nr:Transcriptional regulator [Streptomyces venezuelae]CUM36786.1 hypothetical protein BN2537_2537 [Streptomyces venezuelae]
MAIHHLVPAVGVLLRLAEAVDDVAAHAVEVVEHRRGLLDPGAQFGVLFPLPSLPPFLAPLIRLPLLVPVVYRPPTGPRVQPMSPPTPQDPRFPARHQRQQLPDGRRLP